MPFYDGECVGGPQDGVRYVSLHPVAEVIEQDLEVPLESPVLPYVRPQVRVIGEYRWTGRVWCWHRRETI